MRPLTRAWTTALCVLGLVPGSVAALDPARDPSQYLVDRWGVDGGYPGGAVHALTQDRDGYLWIASERGLVRFDGVTFVLHEPPAGPAGTGTAILGVAPDAQHGVWCRLRGPLVLRRHAGAFSRVDVLGDAYTVVTAMRSAADGSMLLAPLGQGVLRVSDGIATALVSPAQMPSSFVIGLTETADGTLWLGTREAGLLRARDGAVVAVGDGLPDRKVNAVEVDARGRVWAATDKGVVWLRDGDLGRPAMPAQVAGRPVLALVPDRHGNMWLALGTHGLVRVAPDGVATVVPWDAQRDGDVTALVEDRDGQLWVGTSRGLVRLRDGWFRTFTRAHGLPDDRPGAIFVDDEGRTWMAPPTGGLFWLQDGRLGRIAEGGLDADVVYSIAGARDEIWVGRQRGGLSRVRLSGGAAVVTTFTSADGLAQDNVFAVHRDRTGAIWAGTLSGGVSRWHEGRFTTYSVADGLSSNTVTAIAETGDGQVWVGTPTGVNAWRDGHWQRIAALRGPSAIDVTALWADANGVVWVGTPDGLAYVRGEQLHPGPPLSAAHGAVVGIAADAVGRLWVTTERGVLRMTRPMPADGDAPAGGVRAFGLETGLASLEGERRHRSVVPDRQGRVWLSLARGLSLAGAVDPPEPHPVAARLDAAFADEAMLSVVDGVEVPAGTRRVALHLAAPTLAHGERARFSYRLTGFDDTWSAPSPSRQIVYTNLPPGTYGLDVRVGMGEGLDDAVTRVVQVSVAPALWQRMWVQVGALGLLAGAGWLAYRRRLHAVTRRLDRAFEERLAERTRIAQHLHDTLLQGCVSASMHLGVLVDRLPPDAPLRPGLERVLTLMREVAAEGRAAVGGLRTSSDADLLAALGRVSTELLVDHGPAVQLASTGRPRRLHPVIRDEVYRIGREALGNALAHAGGDHVDVTLSFETRRLRLSIRDVGVGMSDTLAREGRPGHFGLRGMRERASAIGATLRVRSVPGAGTEIELVVPGVVAYADEPRPDARRRRWLDRVRLLRRVRHEADHVD